MFRNIPTRALIISILLTALMQARLPADLLNPLTNQKPLLPHFAHTALTFERNVGQTEKSVQFLSRGSGYTLFIKPDEAVFFLKKSAAPAVDKRSPFRPHLQSIKTTPTSGTNVQMQLVGANSKAHALPAEPLLSTSNYLIGNDRTKWHTNIPNYVKVGFSNVYSGVDVVYYGNQGRLEYDFIINPTAKPSAIKLRFAGVKSVKALSNGNLLLAMGNGSLQWHAPIAYQNINGKRHYVKADYQLQSKNEFSFRIGNYDNSQPLVIDPKLLYSTYIGGSNEDVANGIAVDKAGSTFITGTTYSVDFTTTVGSFQTTAASGSNVFVTKFSPDGKSLIYSTFIGGDNNESSSAIVLDSTGNAYITGQTYSSNFPTTPNAFQSTPQGRTDAFLTQLSPNGQSLAYSTYIGGSLDDNATCIALDSLNQVYLGGWANSPNFPATTGALRGGNNGGAYDGFLVKFALLGTSPLYSGYLGGTGYDQVNGVAVDTEGNAYVTGTTSSPDFPVTPKALRTISSGYPSAFVSKINNDGTSLLYSTFLNAKNWVLGYGIAVDRSGCAYITGATAATDYLVSAAAFQKTVGGRFDAFVTKLSPNGRSLVYSTYLGGAKDDLGVAIVLDNSGNAFVTGQTYSSDFPTTPASFQTSSAGGVDGFIAQLSSSGQSLLYSTYLGGTGDDVARGIALESGGKSYIAGYTTSTDFPITADSYQPANPSFAGTAFVVGLPGIKDTTTSASSTTGAIGETLILKAVLTQDRDGSSLTNKNLTFSVDGVNIGVVNTDDTGTAVLIYPLDEVIGVGSHALIVAFTGDSSFNSSLATTSITVNKPLTTLTANDSSGQVGDILHLTATLTRNTDNHPVVNRTVVFVLDGTSIGRAATDANGTATLTYPITEATGVGSHKLLTSFLGDSSYLKSKQTTNLTVKQTDTTLTAKDTAGSIGTTLNLTAVLTRNNDNTGLLGKTVSFTIDSKPVGTGVTDATGTATLAYAITKGLGGGSHTLNTQFAGDVSYNSSAASSNFTVNIDTSIVVGNFNGKYGRSVTLAASLKQMPSLSGLLNQPLTFKVDEVVIGEAMTNSSGKAVLVYFVEDNLTQGTHALTVEYARTNLYIPSKGSATLTLQPALTRTTATATSGGYGKALNFSGVLQRITDNKALANQTLTYLVDGKAVGQATTDSTGTATAAYKVPESLTLGLHTLTIRFAGTTQYDNSSASATFTVNKSETLLTVGKVAGFYGKSIAFTATLKRKTDSGGLPNQPLTFKIDGVSVGQAQTNTIGKALFKYFIDESLPPGSHALSVEFAGTAHYNPSTSTSTLTVKQTDTTLNASFISAKQGATVSLTARLRRITDSKGASGRTITFSIDGSAVGTAITDGEGVAVLSYTIPTTAAKGVHPLDCTFSGDAYYTGSASSGVTLTVK